MHVSWPEVMIKGQLEGVVGSEDQTQVHPTRDQYTDHQFIRGFNLKMDTDKDTEAF